VLSRRFGLIAAAGVLLTTGCSAAINAADKKSAPPPLLLSGFKAAYEMHHIKIGQAFTTVAIPRLHVDVTVVEGVSDQTLKSGAGHYANTPYPGHHGNVAIFGQRSSYGAPFAPLDQLRVGDQVTLRTPIDQETYDVVRPFGGHSNPWVTTPTDPTVLSQSGALSAGHFLTLITNASGGHWLVARLRMIARTAL
jgi:sortase (surface protein transpeptidase)